MRESSDAGRSGTEQEKRVSSLSDRETDSVATASQAEAEASFSEDADSQESHTVSRELNRREEIDSQEEAQTDIRESRDSSRTREVFEEERNEEKTHGKRHTSLGKTNPEQQRQEAPDKRKSLSVKKNKERKSSGSNCFSELCTESTSDTDERSSSTKQGAASRSRQEGTSSAEEQASSSAKKQLHNSSSKRPKDSGKKESRTVTSHSEAQQSRGKVAPETSSARGDNAGDRRAVVNDNEESKEGEEQSCQEETNSNNTRKKLPSASKDNGSNGEVQEQKKDRPGVSHQPSVRGSSRGDSQQSISDQNATGISRSQTTSSTESSQPTSQKSSVYLSVAGDVTGSLTRLSNGSVLSPEPKLYGTRRRLSYAESPGKLAHQPKAKPGTKKSRLPVSRAISRIVLSSPIPEDHKEGTEDGERAGVPPDQSHHKENHSGLPPQSEDGETDSEAARQPANQSKDPVSSLQPDIPEKNKIPSSQASAKDTLTAKQSSEAPKRNSVLKGTQQNSQGDPEQSQYSASEVGMFVSLTSQTQTRLNTVSAVASLSDCEDEEDGFEIVNESKVYRVPAKHPKTVEGGQERNRTKNLSQRRKDPSFGKDRNQSPEEDESHHGKKRSAPKKRIAERTSLSLNGGEEEQFAAGTQTQVKKGKGRKGHVDEHQTATAESEDMELNSQDKIRRSEKGEKNLPGKKRHRSASRESQEPSSEDTRETEEVSKKSRKVVKKKSLTDDNVSSVSQESQEPSSTEAPDGQALSKKPRKVGKKKSLTDDNVSSVSQESQEPSSKDTQETEAVSKKPRKVGKKKSLTDDNINSVSQESEGSSSTEAPEGEAVSKKSRKVGKKKSLTDDNVSSVSQESQEPSSTEAPEGEAVSKKSRKVGKKESLTDDNVSQESKELSSTEAPDGQALSKKPRKVGKKKSLTDDNVSQESKGPSSTEAPEGEAVSKKSRKVGKNKSLTDDNVDESSPVKIRKKNPAVKEKQQRKSLKTSAAVNDTDGDDDENPPQVLQRTGNKPVRSRRSSMKKKKGDTTFATDDEPLLQETTADSDSVTHQKPERKTVKSKTLSKSRGRSNSEDEPLEEETTTDSNRAGKTKKTRTRTKPGKQPVAESSVTKEQKKSTRRKGSSKSGANSSQLEQSEEPVQSSSNRKKRASSSAVAQETSPAKKMRRASAAVDQQDLEDLSENEAEHVLSTPGGQSVVDMSVSDSALKSGISFRRFSHVPSSLKMKRSKQLMYTSSETVEDDIVSSPVLGSASGPHQSRGSSSYVHQQSSGPAGILGYTPVSGFLTRKATGGSGKRKKERRVTISENVTRHSFSPPEKEKSGEEATLMPSMSASPVHYFQQTTPSPSASRTPWADKQKIVPPDGNTTGLRRSRRTRCRPIEWYKNERIIYDRRKSGPVIVGVEPSRERLYLEQENLKRRKRQQKYLVLKKQQTIQGRMKRRLSTHVDVPSELDVTVSTSIPVIHPDTQQEVLMSCFNPASRAPAIGPNGNSVSPEDPFSLKLITQQNLFTTGVLTLAPACEKPLQRTISTAVLYFVTYGKILVTINRATTILETGDHFFVPRGLYDVSFPCVCEGVVYRLKNLRKEEASLTFANLMVDQDDVTL
ncbi:hypothetical protein ACOMHN_034126 [Nucella lapillus]